MLFLVFFQFLSLGSFLSIFAQIFFLSQKIPRYFISSMNLWGFPQKNVESGLRMQLKFLSTHIQGRRNSSPD